MRITPFLLAFSLLCLGGALLAQERLNVLMIVVDDLNDWTGCLGGHPQARTPHIDALAKRGTLFTNAHCQAPACAPSRASLLTGRYPGSTGLYFLKPDLQKSPVLKNGSTLPQRFAEANYHTWGAGKIFHSGDSRFFQKHHRGNYGPLPKKKLAMDDGHPYWDWGAFPPKGRNQPDDRTAAKAVARLHEATDAPFFMAVGFYRPHVPMFAPTRFFEQHPLASVQLPKCPADDVQDLSTYARNVTSLHHVAPKHDWFIKQDKWRGAVQAYLAASTYVDDCIGRVLQALDESPHAHTTIVVLVSDHGFHLGEKNRWAKQSLWERSTRVPMIIAGPDLPTGQHCKQPVELIDLYPTLLALTGLQPDPVQEGDDLTPLINDPESHWEHPAITYFGPENVAIRSQHYRYIRYRDGSQELYDHRSDPDEWKNIAGNPSFSSVLADHAKHLPTHCHPILGKRATGHAAYAAAWAEHVKADSP